MSSQATPTKVDFEQWKAQTEANRQLAQKIVDAMNRGDAAGFLACFSDDMDYWMPGKTPLSGHLKGKKAWMKFQEEVNRHLKQRITVTLKNLIVSGDWIVMEAQGRAVTHKDQDYNNTYCGILQVRDGKVVRVHEYLDTELVSNVLCVG